MKRIGLLLTLIALVIGCFSCKKDPSVVDGIIKISDEKSFCKAGDSISASFKADCKYSGTIKSIKLLISLAGNPSDNDDMYDAQINGMSFNVDGVGLIDDTLYYYKYIVSRYSEEFKRETIWEDSIRILSTKDLQFVPSVKTIGVNSVTPHDAIGVGQVLDDGGSQITKRGLCWSTNTIPTIDDSLGFDSFNDERFSVNMSNLAPNTKYYYRAFAVNSTGPGYGEIKDFTTLDQNTGMSVYTLDVTDVTANSATFNGKVVINKDGGFISVGFLWGLSGTTEEFVLWPKVEEYHGNDAEEYLFDTMTMSLESNATYYVRACVIEKGTEDTIVSSITKSFTTLPAPPEGSINGLFSISEGEQVYFSKGNLQYQASSNTWRFAENQWDFVGGAYYGGGAIGNVSGSTNNDISSIYSGWIDLFGWGTSGYNHGAYCYQPWSTRTDTVDFYWAYGGPFNHLFDNTGQADWGYNPISNGGNTEKNWRTLTVEEWKYLFELRQTASGLRFLKAIVNEVNGVVLLPDNWSETTVVLNNCNASNAEYRSNTISAEDWIAVFQSRGAVFLPAGGKRWNTMVEDAGGDGYYWSSSSYDSRFEYILEFNNTYLSSHAFAFGFYGQSVRLVNKNLKR